MFVFVKKISTGIFLNFSKKGVDFFLGIVYYNQARFVGQAVKTPPSHGGNTGSIPVRTASRTNCFYGKYLYKYFPFSFTQDTIPLLTLVKPGAAPYFML